MSLPKMQTTAVVIRGALCGKLWMPQQVCTLPLRDVDVERVLARFSDASDATMEDVARSVVLEQGGDFQSARFTGDTVVRIERRGYRAGVAFSHAREIPLCKWPRCEMWVNPDIMSYYAEEVCESEDS